MSWLTEDAFWPLALAACAVLVILLVMFAGGRWAVWKPAAAVVLLALLLAAVERLVVTDRERIELLIERGVQAAQRNDVPALESLVDPRAAQLRREIRGEMARIHIEQVRVTHQAISVDARHIPPDANAELIVRMSLRQGRGPVEDIPPVGLRVHFIKGAGGWLISAAQVEDLQQVLGGKAR